MRPMAQKKSHERVVRPLMAPDGEVAASQFRRAPPPTFVQYVLLP